MSHTAFKGNKQFHYQHSKEKYLSGPEFESYISRFPCKCANHYIIRIEIDQYFCSFVKYYLLIQQHSFQYTPNRQTTCSYFIIGFIHLISQLIKTTSILYYFIQQLNRFSINICDIHFNYLFLCMICSLNVIFSLKPKMVCNYKHSCLNSSTKFPQLWNFVAYSLQCTEIQN